VSHVHKSASEPVVSPWLTTEQAGKYLNLNPETLSRWRWLGEGGPVFHRVGVRAVRYHVKELDEFIQGVTS
jgi:excisionase family DNA binding protein